MKKTALATFLFFLTIPLGLSTDVNLTVNVTPAPPPPTLAETLVRPMNFALMSIFLLGPITYLIKAFMSSPRTIEDFIKNSVIFIILLAFSLAMVGVLA